MVRSNKLRGVRQRHWGSWVSEIRHPLLKRRMWLGTFDSAERAAKAYDEAALLIHGPNAKTNFPTNGSISMRDVLHHGSKTSNLTSKISKLCREASPSLTCLRLDPEALHIGLWRTGAAGTTSDSNWVMRIELGTWQSNTPPPMLSPVPKDSSKVWENEESVALQMVEELTSEEFMVDFRNSQESPIESKGTEFGVRRASHSSNSSSCIM